MRDKDLKVYNGEDTKALVEQPFAQMIMEGIHRIILPFHQKSELEVGDTLKLLPVWTKGNRESGWNEEKGFVVPWSQDQAI